MAEIIDGFELKLNGRVLVIPPLNFKRVRQLRNKLVEISLIKSVPSDEQMNTINQVVLSALERNYPDMTLAEVDDMLDLGNTAKVLRAIMGAAGLEEQAEKLTARP